MRARFLLKMSERQARNHAYLQVSSSSRAPGNSASVVHLDSRCNLPRPPPPLQKKTAVNALMTSNYLTLRVRELDSRAERRLMSTQQDRGGRPMSSQWTLASLLTSFVQRPGKSGKGRFVWSFPNAYTTSSEGQLASLEGATYGSTAHWIMRPCRDKQRFRTNPQRLEEREAAWHLFRLRPDRR